MLRLNHIVAALAVVACLSFSSLAGPVTAVRCCHPDLSCTVEVDSTACVAAGGLTSFPGDICTGRCGACCFGDSCCLTFVDQCLGAVIYSEGLLCNAAGDATVVACIVDGGPVRSRNVSDADDHLENLWKGDNDDYRTLRDSP